MKDEIHCEHQHGGEKYGENAGWPSHRYFPFQPFVKNLTC
jgi:hypothetical protein